MQHQSFINTFFKIIQNNKLSHLYLITGLTLPQRKEFVFELSYQIFKSKDPQNDHLFLKQALIDGTYPNFYYLNKDDHLFKKDQIMQLQKVFHQGSLFGKERIYVIEEIEKTTLPAANSLLHFLENTPNNTIGFLLTSNLDQVLSTIVSRCQVININNGGQQLLTPFLSDCQKLSKDSLDFYLNPLINSSSSQTMTFVTSDYYQHFRSCFLFFIDQWPKTTSLKLSFSTFYFTPVLINSFSDFLIDFVSVLLRWFLDLFYEKKQLPIYFENQNNYKSSFQNLTLQQNINILQIIKKYHQKKPHLVNPQNIFFALMIELEDQK
ncbi:DNA polymerase III delta' subunit [Candidatus Phytoplasma solani]|uniref:DNA polymerase III subunit delta' n=1 Tax=Candidatus Phytoplasma solani TaxID=69896 RepID=UPI0032DAFAC2